MKVQIDEKKLKGLIEESQRYNAMLEMGVDNWEGWDEWDRPTEEDIQSEFEALTKEE